MIEVMFAFPEWDAKRIMPAVPRQGDDLVWTDGSEWTVSYVTWELHPDNVTDVSVTLDPRVARTADAMAEQKRAESYKAMRVRPNDVAHAFNKDGDSACGEWEVHPGFLLKADKVTCEGCITALSAATDRRDL